MSLSYDTEKWLMVTLAMVAVSVTVGLILMQYAHAGTIRIEGIMDESKDGYFLFPKNGIFEINNSKICPSNHCELIRDGGILNEPFYISFNEQTNFLSLAGRYRLQDDITNGHFTPKKQKLVEDVLFYFFCSFDDIQENKNGTTKYICTDNFGGSGLRMFNQTYYDYKVNMTFELPSRHFIFNGEDRE
jgi:hypothetical protein